MSGDIRGKIGKRSGRVPHKYRKKSMFKAALLHDVDDFKLSPETYENKDRVVVLFQLRGLMNTATAKKIAKQREDYMKSYISEFLDEWDGIR